jgi:hypothetical protein
MTPRIDWIALVTWSALLLAALSFAFVVGAGVVWLGQRILAAVWPFAQAHSDGLTLGLCIGVALAAGVALALESDKR